MVVHQVEIERFSVFEPEDDPPVCSHGDRPKPFSFSREGMKSERRLVQGLDMFGGLQDLQYLLQLSHVVRVDASCNVVLEKLTQCFVSERADYVASEPEV